MSLLGFGGRFFLHPGCLVYQSLCCLRIGVKDHIFHAFKELWLDVVIDLKH